MVSHIYVTCSLVISYSMPVCMTVRIQCNMYKCTGCNVQHDDSMHSQPFRNINCYSSSLSLQVRIISASISTWGNITLILFMYILLVVSCEVQHLSSSLDATGRRHACSGETLTFTCEVTGTMLIWTTESDQNRLIFFDNDRVDTVRVTQEVRAILLRNNPSSIIGERRLSSVLLIPVTTHSQMNAINVTCSSGTPPRTMSTFYRITGIIAS